MNDAYQDLDNLIKSPGWQRFKEAQETYWRDQLVPHVRNAAASDNDEVAIQKIRQIAAAERAIRMALEWPETQMRTMKQQEGRYRVDSMSRGGI